MDIYKRLLEPQIDRTIALDEITDTPVQAYLDEQRSVRLTLPYGCYFGAGPDCRPDTETRLIMYELRVHSQLRQAMIGSRLVSSMLYIAKELKPDRFSGLIQSEYSLRILRNIVGETGITYRHYLRKTDKEIILPLTTDQAIQSLDWIMEEGDPEYDGITASINLGKVALGDLEKPAGADEVIDSLQYKFKR